MGRGGACLALCSTSFAIVFETCTTSSGCPCARVASNKVPTYVELRFGCTSNLCQPFVGSTPSCKGGTITRNQQDSNYIAVSCRIPASTGGTLTLTKQGAANPFITMSTGTPALIQDSYFVSYMPNDKNCSQWADSYGMSQANAVFSGTIPQHLTPSSQYNNSVCCFDSNCSGLMGPSYEYSLHP